jgi:hypothetical protein
VTTCYLAADHQVGGHSCRSMMPLEMFALIKIIKSVYNAVLIEGGWKNTPGRRIGGYAGYTRERVSKKFV